LYEHYAKIDPLLAAFFPVFIDKCPQDAVAFFMQPRGVDDFSAAV